MIEQDLRTDQRMRLRDAKRAISDVYSELSPVDDKETYDAIVDACVKISYAMHCLKERD